MATTLFRPGSTPDARDEVAGGAVVLLTVAFMGIIVTKDTRWRKHYFGFFFLWFCDSGAVAAKTKQIAFKCEPHIDAMIKSYSMLLQRKPSDFARLCVEACVVMADDPNSRVVPEVIRDVMDRRKRSAIALADDPSHPLRHAEDGPVLRAAEDPPDYPRKAKR